MCDVFFKFVEEIKTLGEHKMLYLQHKGLDIDFTLSNNVRSFDLAGEFIDLPLE